MKGFKGAIVGIIAAEISILLSRQVSLKHVEDANSLS